MTTHKSIWQKIDEARKAVGAFLIPGLVILGGALTEASDGGTKITTTEWLTATIAVLGTGGFVYGVKNAESNDPKTSTPGPRARLYTSDEPASDGTIGSGMER